MMETEHVTSQFQVDSGEVGWQRKFSCWGHTPGSHVPSGQSPAPEVRDLHKRPPGHSRSQLLLNRPDQMPGQGRSNQASNGMEPTRPDAQVPGEASRDEIMVQQESICVIKLCKNQIITHGSILKSYSRPTIHCSMSPHFVSSP